MVGSWRMNARVIVIGGGAAGFFAAIHAKLLAPWADVLLLEKSDKLLAKVKVSGGGRCNVTHACFQDKALAAHYPRGERMLRKAFTQWNVRDTIAWFATRGVELRTEADGRMFPVTDSSQTIVDALISAARDAGVKVRDHVSVQAIRPIPAGFELAIRGEAPLMADRVIVATGGSPKREGLQWLADLGHSVVDPVPSLFTFNLPDEPIRELMGVVADPVRVRITGTDLDSKGPLLITHWGFSGPAVLRLSAWGARVLNSLDYRFTVQVNWAGGNGEEFVRAALQELRSAQPRKLLRNATAFGLPNRLWSFLMHKAGLESERQCGELQKKEINRLVDLITNDRYVASGKTTFKEEFVTAGGVDLNDVDPATMESRKVPGLFFAGEVLDIDGITGGFNFQAAWTTGYMAGKSAASSLG